MYDRHSLCKHTYTWRKITTNPLKKTHCTISGKHFYYLLLSSETSSRLIERSQSHCYNKFQIFSQHFINSYFSKIQLVTEYLLEITSSFMILFCFVSEIFKSILPISIVLLKELSFLIELTYFFHILTYMHYKLCLHKVILVHLASPYSFLETSWQISHYRHCFLTSELWLKNYL